MLSFFALCNTLLPFIFPILILLRSSTRTTTLRTTASRSKEQASNLPTMVATRTPKRFLFPYDFAEAAELIEILEAP
jgi:hypothetical protein